MVGVVLAALVLAGAAAAAPAETPTDHVLVNAAGRNATRSFSKTLSVDVSVVSGYTRKNFDGDEGNWDGPGYHASQKATLSGATHLGWGVTFDVASQISLEGLAKRYALDFGSWRVLEESSKAIPHVVGGAKVGTISGLMLLTQAPGDTASAFSSAVAFPLCKGVIGVAHFSTLTPNSTSAAPFGSYLVDDGTDVQTWNRDHISASLDNVVLNGYLPVGRLTARAGRRVVQGNVVDCVGHPMPGVAVRVGRVRVTTNATGAYVAHVAPGAAIVSVTAGGGSVHARVRVRAS